VPQFLGEFEEFASSLVLQNPGQPLCIMGDFNFHLDKPDDPNAALFSDLLSSMDLHQHVTKPTHRSGHLLHLIITRSPDSAPGSLVIHDACISDHCLITCAMNVHAARAPVRNICARSTRKVRPVDLAERLDNRLNPPDAISDFDLHVSSFSSALASALDELAPLRSIKLKGDDQKPWYSDAIHEARKKRRAYERLYRKSGLEIHSVTNAKQLCR
jgi:hypothetical protein